MCACVTVCGCGCEGWLHVWLNPIPPHPPPTITNDVDHPLYCINMGMLSRLPTGVVKSRRLVNLSQADFVVNHFYIFKRPLKVTLSVRPLARPPYRSVHRSSEYLLNNCLAAFEPAGVIQPRHVMNITAVREPVRKQVPRLF